MAKYQIKVVNSLQKVFPKKEPESMNELQLTGLWGETLSFQIAYHVENKAIDFTDDLIEIQIESPFDEMIDLRHVGLVPSQLPAYGDYDDNYLTTDPGLFPDVLYPLVKDNLPDEKIKRAFVKAVPEQWRAVWVDFRLDKKIDAGTYPICLRVKNSEGEVLWSERLEIEVIGVQLPEQELVHTEWFHADCLADYYQVPVFSEMHWQIIDHFMETAVKHGMTMILTPLFTPPLDTQVGGERTTVQLVDVTITPDGYGLSFDKLERWIDLAIKNGFQYFEMAHLFSQWGAKYSPKVMAKEQGQIKQIFGWEVKGDSLAYSEFLAVFLPALDQFLIQKGIKNQTYFHLSDEPHEGDQVTYRQAKQVIQHLLEDYPVIDALSSYPIYKEGLIDHPIVSIDQIHEFLDAGVEEVWAYNCCAQYLKVSNRFMAMPSARNRVLGVQLYKYQIKGYLHWGYNFYNSQYSTKKINPFLVTDSGEAFPSGDPFLVYPGEDKKPIESIRLMTLSQALYDLRSLKLLEKMVGRPAVLALIEEGLDEPLTFEVYPRTDDYLFELREKVNQRIKEEVDKTIKDK